MTNTTTLNDDPKLCIRGETDGCVCRDTYTVGGRRSVFNRLVDETNGREAPTDEPAR